MSTWLIALIIKPFVFLGYSIGREKLLAWNERTNPGPIRRLLFEDVPPAATPKARSTESPSEARAGARVRPPELPQRAGS